MTDKQINKVAERITYSIVLLMIIIMGGLTILKHI